MIRIFQENKKRVNFWNFFVCYHDNSYKFLLTDFEDCEEKESLASQSKYSALLIYGFFKELIGAYYQVNPKNIDKILELLHQGALNKFLNTINILISSIAKNNEITQGKLQQTRKYLNHEVDKFSSNLYKFRNDEIYLIEQPVFNNLKAVIFEITPRYENPRELLDFIAKTLKHKK